MKEYEKKALITQEEYDVLTDLYKGMSVESQINSYFDTNDYEMNRRGITCRIRSKNGKHKTTIKKHSPDRLGCSVEEDLGEGEEFDCRVFEALGLHFQGKLITKRMLIIKDAFCEVVIDRNEYLGYTDYEIEAEYISGYENRAEKYLESVAEHLVSAKLIDSAENFLLRVGKGKSKSQRFFNRKRYERR